MTDFFPIFLRTANIKITIIGGGTVGTIRAREMTNAGFSVRVVSEKFSDELIKFQLESNKLELVQKRVNPSNLDEEVRDSTLVIASTDDPIMNQELCKKARSIGKLCNDPSERDASDFIVPISFIDDNFGIAITTFGNSSLVSKELMKLTVGIAHSTRMMNLLRAMTLVKLFLKENVKDPRRRYSLYHVIFEDEKFRDLAEKGEIDESIQRAKQLVEIGGINSGSERRNNK